MEWFYGHYLERHRRRPPPTPACRRSTTTDWSGLPPALVITAEFDPLRDEGEAYAAKLAADGVPTTLHRYDGQIHGFFSLGALVPDGKAAVAEAAAALAEALKTSG